MDLNALIERMKFHGYSVYENGIFYKPYEGKFEYQEAIDWLKSLED